MSQTPGTVTTQDDLAVVREVLAEYGEMTRAALEPYLPKWEPRRHLYDLIADYPRRGGKMMRPTLCLATARAFGARPEEALRSAVAIELLHNALLVHDDIEDGSEQRRGRPTMHEMFGVPIAINVGDTLGLLSLRPLMDNLWSVGMRLAWRIMEETERMARESAEGQALELGWREQNVTDLTEADYLSMVLKKTCWLATIHPLRVGALIGSRGGVDVDRFIRFGFFLGAVFQIRDDLLNLTGDETAYGKEVGGDILEGKRTLMLIRLLRVAAPAERARVEALLGLPRIERHVEEVAWVRERMDHHGCLDYARGIAHGLAGAAAHELDLAFEGVPASRDRRFIQSLVTWSLERAA
ncbi:MAG: polyprenyl synthetase family protein [Acidobacteriota bacterium]